MTKTKLAQTKQAASAADTAKLGDRVQKALRQYDPEAAKRSAERQRRIRERMDKDPTLTFKDALAMERTREQLEKIGRKAED